MQRKIFRNTGLFLLAVVFSTGLMFAFTELPRLADQWLQTNIETPHSDPAYDAMRHELFFDAYAIRLIGFICLGVILFFIILGFATRKTGWALAGSVGLFLPVFATFAHSMFYLAGLGLFNVILFPFLDISMALVDLGKVVLIPYWILIWLSGLFNWYAHDFIVHAFMLIGAFIFILGVFTWFQTRYSKTNVASNWIYRYSRHPQYLGWIIWSYGLMLYGPSLNQMKKSWGWNSTLPWLLSTLVIIGICLLEEIKMQEKAGKTYKKYRDSTPFLFPLPDLLKKIISAPMRMVIRKPYPETKKQAGVVVALYAVIFMGLSLFWVDLKPGDEETMLIIKPYSQQKADSLVSEIRKSQPRRNRTLEPFGHLVAMGKKATPVLIKLIKDPDSDVRDMAVQAVYTYNIRQAIPSLIKAIHDPEFRVAQSAIRALGELNATKAADTLFYFLKHPQNGVHEDVILSALGNIGDHRITPWLEKRLENSKWYQHSRALRSMMQLDFEAAKPHIYKSLQDERDLVRREAVTMLLETLPEDAIPYLQTVTNDDNWDVRFYARQAIRLIEKKYHQE